MSMPQLRSTTHTLSVINIEDHEPRRAAVTYSDQRVLHYAHDPLAAARSTTSSTPPSPIYAVLSTPICRTRTLPRS